MLKVYEFSTKLTPDGKLVIPDDFTKKLPVSETVRVIILVDEANPLLEEEQETLPSLEQVIADIKNTPLNPGNINQASGLLAEHLTHPLGEPDPLFDVQAWNRQWDKIEADMEATEFAHEQAEAESD